MFPMSTEIGQVGNCCEKCGPMGCFVSDFPTFLIHSNACCHVFAETPAGCTVIDLGMYIHIFFFSALGSPTGVGADLI